LRGLQKGRGEVMTMSDTPYSYFALAPKDCSGCLSCELACSFQHVGYFDRFKSRVRILVDEERSKIDIHQCIQCAEPACVAACPAGALSVNEEHGGYIALDETICTQCKKCYQACEYHGAFWDEEANLPLICDLCQGDPQCVKPCRLHKAIQVRAEAQA
jgi:carbon-monoxide dehydrogenase iron sulfur subunit